MKHSLPQPYSGVRYFKYTDTVSSLLLLFITSNVVCETLESNSHADSPQIFIRYKMHYQIYEHWQLPLYQAGLPLLGKLCKIYSFSHLLHKTGIKRQSAFLDMFMMMREILHVRESRQRKSGTLITIASSKFHLLYFTSLDCFLFLYCVNP